MNDTIAKLGIAAFLALACLTDSGCAQLPGAGKATGNAGKTGAGVQVPKTASAPKGRKAAPSPKAPGAPTAKPATGKTGDDTSTGDKVLPGPSTEQPGPNSVYKPDGTIDYSKVGGEPTSKLTEGDSQTGSSTPSGDAPVVGLDPDNSFRGNTNTETAPTPEAPINE
ncbi:MAG: hypothetical protein HY303_01840 [Candidatus Wallbacteria bacterium]|nr:hypothetical protein [Candidatus Wallbacteria bacterium]